MIVKSAEKFHYGPKPIDDEFSSLVYVSFLDMIDPRGLILAKSDIDKLNVHIKNLDEEILRQQCSFIDLVSDLYKKRLASADSIIKSLAGRKMDVSRTETLTLSKETVYVSRGQLVEKWRKWIAFQTLSSYLSSTGLEKLPPKPSDKTLAELQVAIIERENCKIKSRLNEPGGIQQYIGSRFLKALSSAYDPHTEYFTPEEKSAFDVMLSEESFSFGLEISKNEAEEIEVVNIVPGSPAWNSNALNEGDIIYGVKTTQGISKEFNCLDMEAVGHFLSSLDNNGGVFHVRKKSGREVHVSLHKEKISVEENVIKSFVLEGKRKIGYINLPVFYAPMDSLEKNSTGCSNDIAKELIKLKREGINGLVFDLRNNGGGSMLEAIRLAGIFVNFGALSILDSRDDGPLTLKDMDRGTIFDAPLVILVNAFSASASELFAAAMQDYNRAVIVGGKTFGKSTAQILLPLDAYQDKPIKTGSPPAYIKITTGKFYRVTGKSHQKEGILPDITLPDMYDSLEVGEAFYPSAMKATTLEKKTYYTPLSLLPVSELRRLSEKRVNTDSAFASIKTMGALMAKRNKTNSLSLEFSAFLKFYKSHEMLFTQAVQTSKNTSLFKVKNPSYLTGVSSFTDSKKVINDFAISEIEKDVYVKEAFQIINDLIELKK